MSNENINQTSRPRWAIFVAIFAMLFGLLTIKEGGLVLFTKSGKDSAGHYVPFVLWFNFIAGFFYILAGIAVYRLKTCVKKLAASITVATLIVFFLLGIHIYNNGIYEQRTVIAMTVRSSVWLLITFTLFRSRFFKTVQCNC